MAIGSTIIQWPGVDYDVFATWEDEIDKQTAVMLNDPQNSLITIEENLGPRPSGIHVDMKTRIESIETTLSTTASTFVELQDTPASYVGQADSYIRVKNTVDGLEFISSGAAIGDMEKTTYDTTDNGIADNTERLDNKLESEFLLVDGSRGLSADWDAGNVSITAKSFISDIATGTAPFTVVSTTLVNNLNASTLDGYIASELVPSGMILMWDGLLANIPTGWSLHTTGYGRYIKSIDNGTNEPGDTGGTNSFGISIAQMAVHDHTTVSGGGSHSHGNPSSAGAHTDHVLPSDGIHGHTASTSSAGSHTHTFGRDEEYNPGGAWKVYSGTNSTTTSTDGSHSHSSLSINNSASHTHSVSTTGSHIHTANSTSIAHAHTLGNAGSGNAVTINPAYYKMALIIKS